MKSRRRPSVLLGVIGLVALPLTAVQIAKPNALAGAYDDVAARMTHHIGAPGGGTMPPPFPVDDPPLLRLAAAGDVGTGSPQEHAVADAMAAVGDERSFDALLLLGDNVYPAGDPSQLRRAVFEPFAATLESGAELLAVLGNHDVENGNGDAQSAALGMPGRWYARQLGPVLFIGLDSTRPDDPEQRAWLDETLAATAATWKIVAMHHPPYSAGRHGSDQQVRNAFQPSFERYGVQLVLAGHDHDYQRSKPINGVTYIVSGAAAKTRLTGRERFTATSWSARHFLDLSIWSDRLTVRAIGQDGLVHDIVTRRP